MASLPTTMDTDANIRSAGSRSSCTVCLATHVVSTHSEQCLIFKLYSEHRSLRLGSFRLLSGSMTEIYVVVLSDVIKCRVSMHERARKLGNKYIYFA